MPVRLSARMFGFIIFLLCLYECLKVRLYKKAQFLLNSCGYQPQKYTTP